MRYFIITLLSFTIFICNSINAQCLNGDAELGDFTNWSGATSIRTPTGVNINQMVNGINPPFHLVTSQGYDPKVGGSLLSMVGEGNHSFRIGDDKNNTHGDRLSYTFTVTSLNANFGFMYAMVLEDGLHPLEQNPSFSYIIQKGNNPNIFNFSGPNQIIQSKQFRADLNNPFFKKRGNIVWKDWTYECIDLSRYIGEIVTISFYALDCAQTAHFGYAYIDGLCSNHNPIPSFNIASKFCISDDIIMNASNSENEDSYFLSVQEADQWWNIKGPEISQWFVAKKAGEINLKQFLESHGQAFKCNTYYRVKLAVSNNCVSWADTTKLIFITCPKINQLDNIIKCCSNNNEFITVGPVYNNPPNIYFVNWNAAGGVFGPINLFNPLSVTAPNALFLFNSNGKVDVTVSEIYYENPIFKICSLTETVYFFKIDDFDITIEEESKGCCETKLKVNVDFKGECSAEGNLTPEQQEQFINSLNYQWSNGSTSKEITVSGETKDYSVTVSTPQNCSTPKTASYHYQQSPAYSNTPEYDVVFSAPNALVPGNQGLSGKLVIMAGTYDQQGLLFPNAGTNKGIYKSEAIRLTIYNRWGELFWTKTFYDCGELYQGDVYWDGKDNNGNYVPTGAYVYKIEIKRCGEEFKWYCNDSHMLTQRCAKKFLFWCLKWENSYDVGGPCAFWINVIN